MKLPEPRHSPPSLVARVFAVLAASLFVVALASATLAPAATTLLDALRAMDANIVIRVQSLFSGRAGSALWRMIAAPVLGRPVWLIPLSLGLVCAGIALSFSMSAPHQKRHRSS